MTRIEELKAEIAATHDACRATKLPLCKELIKLLEAACARKDAALREAMDVIKIYHGPVAWDIYEKSAPEMQRFRAALTPARETGETK